MSIKRLPPEAIEVFSIVLHPKRTYSARLSRAADAVPATALTTEASDPLTTEGGDYLVTEN